MDFYVAVGHDCPPMIETTSRKELVELMNRTIVVSTGSIYSILETNETLLPAGLRSSAETRILE